MKFNYENLKERTYMETEFRKLGQSYYTQLYNLKCCRVIANLHESNGLDFLDRELIAEHTKRLHERRNNGELGEGFYYR